MKPFALVTALFLSACAGSTYKVNQFHENPKIKPSHLKGKRVFVAPLLLEATSVGNSSPRVDSGKQALYIVKDSLAKVYGTGLTERFQKRFKRVTVVPQPDYARYNAVLTSEKLIETVQHFGKSKAEYFFKHPRKEVLDSLGIQADIIVYCTSVGVTMKDLPIDSDGGIVAMGGGGGTWSHGMSFGANGKPVAGATFHPGGGGVGGIKKNPDPIMQTFVKFIVWDYTSNSAVSFGQYQEQDDVNRDQIERHWKTFTSTLTDRIVRNTLALL